MIDAAVPALLRSLGEVVGDAAVLAEPEDLIPFGFDGTAALRQRPGGVVFPHTTEEVVRCVRRRGGTSRARS